MKILNEEIKKILIDKTGLSNKRPSGANLKFKLIKFGVIENKCSICNIHNMYNGRALNLHLDHINGNPFDNRIENLRLLCPNCHSQTDTFCGKNKKSHLLNKTIKKDKVKKFFRRVRIKRADNFCKMCNKKISYKTKHCKKCNGIYCNPPKIVWPTIEELEILLKKYNYTQLGKLLGVSDNAIRKRIRKNGKSLPETIYNNRPKNNRSDGQK